MYNSRGEFKGNRYKVKLVSKATLLEMLNKHFGIYEAQKHEVKHTLDWDSLYAAEDEDIIEGRIADASKPQE